MFLKNKLHGISSPAVFAARGPLHVSDNEQVVAPMGRPLLSALLLGVAAIGAVAVATAVLSGTGLQPRPPDSAATARVVDTLANRDFIYLGLALSTVGRAWWFVALVATGTPIFVLAALWANRGRPRT
jgi:hypothetical protein